MSSRGPYRRHMPQFRLQLCQDIGSGAIGRDAARHHNLSTNLLQLWLTQYDRRQLSNDEAEAYIIAEYEARIAALERKVGQLTMELDLAKKTPRLRLVSGNKLNNVRLERKPAPRPTKVREHRVKKFC